MRPRKQSFDILQIVGNIRIGVDVFRRNEQWLFHDGQMMPIQRSGSKGVNGYCGLSSTNMNGTVVAGKATVEFGGGVEPLQGCPVLPYS